MVSNPFSEGLSVAINADSSGLEEGLDNSMAKLEDMKKAVGGLSLALGGLAAAGIGKSIQAAAEFESQLADLEKVTSAELVKPLRQGIMDLSEEVPMARKGLVELATQAGKFGAETEAEIMAFTKNVGKIASATDLAAQEAGTRFAKIAGAIGMPMDEIGKLGNAVNSLADSMKTDANEITDTATRASNILSQQLGLGQDTVLALSASMNEVSSSSRLAASSLRRMAETMMDPRKMGDMAAAVGMTKDEFKAMVKTEPEKLMKRLAAAMKENGRGADILRSTIGKAANDFNKLASQTDQTAKAQQVVNEQFKNGTSLQREMDIRTNTLSGQMQLLSNKVNNVATRLGDAFLPMIKTVVARLTPVLDRFAAWIETIDKTTLAISSATGTLGLLGVGLAAFAGGPITLAIAAVGALAAAFATDFMGIRTTVTNAIQYVNSLFVKHRSELLRLKQSVMAAMSGARDAFMIVKNVAQFVFETYLMPLLQRLSGVFKQHFGDILREVTETLDALMKYARIFGQKFNTFWNKWGDEISTVAKVVWTSISNIIETALDFVLTTIRVILNLIQGDWEAAWDAMAGFLKRTLDRIVGYWEWLYDTLIGGSIIPNMLSAILSAVKGWNIAGAFKSVLGGASSAVKSAISSIVSSVKSALSRVRSIGSRISSAVSSARSRASSAVSGIRSRIPGLQSGGFIESGGLAELHAGERVVPAAQVDRGGGGGVVLNMNGDIVASGRKEGRQAARVIEKDLLSEAEARF